MTIYTKETREELLKLPRTRKEAIKLGSTYYFTDKNCKHEHKSKRLTSTGSCYECIRIIQTSEKKKEYDKQYRNDNEELIIQRRKYYHKENKETNNERTRKWNQKNAEQARNNRKQWKLDNPDKVAAQNAKRRAKKLNQTPENADLERIKEFYTTSQEIQKMYPDVKVNVDHIIPISKGGLHHEDNLQILTESQNCSKGDKLDWTNPDLVQYYCPDLRGVDPELKEWINANKFNGNEIISEDS